MKNILFTLSLKTKNVFGLALILFFTFSFSLFTNSALAQNLDSLYSVWQDETQTDSTRTKAFDDYIWDGFLFSNPDTAFILAQKLLRFGEEQSYKKAKALAYNSMGISKALKSDYPEALDYFQRNLRVYEELGDKTGSAHVIGNIGTIYKEQGDYYKALEYLQRSLKIREETKDIKGSAIAIVEIGSIYQLQQDYPKALNNYLRCLKIFEETENLGGSATTMGNIGNIYLHQGDYPKALDYQRSSLKIREEIGDKHGTAIAINNIGNIYSKQGDDIKALDYYQRSLKISEKIKDKRNSSNTFYAIGTIYKNQGDYPKALEYCKKALLFGEEIGALAQKKKACECLYESYKAMGKGNEALVYLEKVNILSDSLSEEETSKKLQQMEFQKEMLADSIAKVEEARIVEEAHQEEVHQGEKTRNILGGIGILVLILAGGLYGRVRYIRKAKAVLQSEKDRSENLLLNILPADIAAELKEKGKADARDFEMVSILFTDFKGFTEASAKLSAQDLVSEINTCFEAFDGIMGKYNIEKIKTIGDAYMAAGGLPVPTEDSVKNTVLVALEMQDFISKRKVELDAEGKPCFEMRVGIHTGPVVAGIVGVKKFQYDIWGDTVNTASRMESSGAVGQVNVSQATYEVLKSDSQFAFESRGKIEAKGKGEIEMYFVSKT